MPEIASHPRFASILARRRAGVRGGADLRSRSAARRAAGQEGVELWPKGCSAIVKTPRRRPAPKIGERRVWIASSVQPGVREEGRCARPENPAQRLEKARNRLTKGKAGSAMARAACKASPLQGAIVRGRARGSFAQTRRRKGGAVGPLARKIRRNVLKRLETDSGRHADRSGGPDGAAHGGERPGKDRSRASSRVNPSSGRRLAYRPRSAPSSDPSRSRQGRWRCVFKG